MSLVRGVVIGRVKALDAAHRGQVQVEFPLETEDQCGIAYDWARVATLMAGADRGTWFMPEIGDEVLVAFANDDAVDPYVIGYLWSEPPGNAAQPPSGAAFGQRRIRSTRGHTLTFDDTDARTVEIRSSGGHTITLDDAAGKVEVHAANSNRITLDANGIELVVGGRRIAMTASTIELR
jgi:uncharacterized protein involved in type VI secretion and phage assembly